MATAAELERMLLEAGVPRERIEVAVTETLREEVKKVTPPAAYTLTIEVQGQGETDLPVGRHSYAPGTEVTVYATPALDWEFEVWLENGVPDGTTSIWSGTITRNLTLAAVFQEVLPERAPPPEDLLSVDECTRFGYHWWEGACHAEEEPPPPVGEIEIPADIPFPWGYVVSGFWAVAKGFMGLIEWFGKALATPVEAAIKGFITDLETALMPGSPEKEIEKQGKRLALLYRRRIEKMARKVVRGSPDLDLAHDEALNALATMITIELSTGVAALIADAVHPLKRIGIKESAGRIMDMMGLFDINRSIARIPADIGIMAPLRYYYNKQYTPLIPGLSDLIYLRRKEAITPEQYAFYAAWHGESGTWADRRWRAHWREVAPGMYHNALHRGLIKEEQWEYGLIINDYNPEPWKPDFTPDLDLVRGLRKTLIPRVDTRRGWEYGVLARTEELREMYHAWKRGEVTLDPNDDAMARRYDLLGYEDDTLIQVEIQKRAALDGEINMVRREYIYWLEQGLMSADDLDRAFEDLETLRPRIWYWKAYARLRAARKAKEPLPEVAELSPEEAEKVAEEEA